MSEMVYTNIRVWGGHAVMNAETARQAEMLKDGEGRYLYHVGLAEGEPDTFRGRPVRVVPGFHFCACGHAETRRHARFCARCGWQFA